MPYISSSSPLFLLSLSGIINMTWSKDYYPEELKHLRKSIREKAIEIANTLVESGQKKKQAIAVAIAKARSFDRTAFKDKNRSSTLRCRKNITSPSINFYIVKIENRWGLKGENDALPSISFESIDEALERGKTLIRITKGSLYIDNDNGALQQIVY
jgi:GH43 family beta-xylosidase